VYYFYNYPSNFLPTYQKASVVSAITSEPSNTLLHAFIIKQFYPSKHSSIIPLLQGAVTASSLYTSSEVAGASLVTQTFARSIGVTLLYPTADPLSFTLSDTDFLIFKLYLSEHDPLLTL
jgi:hypothetical protein